MSFYFQLIILGLPIGVLWALLATSVVMIYRASRVLNLAVGGTAMFTAYVMYQLNLWGVPVVLALIGALAFAVLFGIATERWLLRPLRDKPMLVSVIMTVGVLALTTELASDRWGVDRQNMPRIMPSGAVHFAGIAVGLDRIFILAITLLVMAAVVYLFRYTTLGISMRAVSDDRRAAQLMGVPAGRVSTTTWALGGLLGGTAGILLSPVIGLTPNGLVFQSIPALAAALFGGLVSIELTFIGAMVLGVLWSLLPGISFGSLHLREVTGVQEAAIFLLVIAFLYVRWEALFGSELREEEI
ncbi:MAG: branched-chain amino acid ABC transporter permease [Actinomycetota bacterium]|nr:branched-chain amino acid ABC transporter permease [Actinomycetota bacterium]